MKTFPLAVLAIALAAAAGPGAAALSDEIQVYTDDINAPGQFGLELHVNTTPRGRTAPEYPGEVVPNRGWRVTPELSYGLTPSFEAGLYLPLSRDSNGNTAVAGAKLRLKWMPVRADEHGGWFLGANTELSRLKRRFSASRESLELRGMTGYSGEDWLIAVNPLLGWSLSRGYRGSPDLALAVKVARTAGNGVAVGVEYYSELGTLRRVLSASEQANTLYATVDWKGKGWDVNFGVGRGLTGSSDRLTVKAIVGFPF